MAKKKAGIYETVEWLDSAGNVVKSRKAKWLGECPSEEVFKKSVEGIEKKMFAAHIGRMNMVERVVDQPDRVVIMIKMVLVFQCDQRWSYVWVK